jgi:anti-anti-sigma factor
MSVKAPANQPFTVECVRSANQLSVRVSGRLVATSGRPVWMTCLENAPGADIGIELGSVTAMDASGIGLLAEFARTARAEGRRVAVVSASRRVRRLLELTRLDGLLASGCTVPRVAA